MKTFFLNYSDDRYNHKGGQFRARQLALNKSAADHGMKNIVAWKWEDMITREFYRSHKEFLDKDRFHNGAVFKPYIVLELLEQIEPGAVVFYCDCIRFPINRSLEPMIALCKKNGGTLFHQYGDQNRNWTKRDAFVYMDCDAPKYHNAVALQNTWFLIQKNEFAMQFVQEWLSYNLDERIASYVMPDTCGLPPLKGFKENRGDQSIFSNLAVKYGVKSYFGVGGSKNKDLNKFMTSLPRNGPEALLWAVKRSLIKLNQKRILAGWTRHSPK